MAAVSGAEHVLLAYPLVGPNHRRFLKLVSTYRAVRFYALFDDLSQLAVMDTLARAAGIKVEIFVDVNTEIGRAHV